MCFDDVYVKLELAMVEFCRVWSYLVDCLSLLGVPCLVGINVVAVMKGKVEAYDNAKTQPGTKKKVAV